MSFHPIPIIWHSDLLRPWKTRNECPLTHPTWIGNKRGFCDSRIVQYSDFAKALLNHPGIIRIELITGDVRKEIEDIEYSPMNVGFAPNDPMGLQDVLGKDLRLILFCSHEFRMFTEPFIDIVDSRGSLIGHDVMDCEKDKYDDPDLVWLTSNIFMNPNLVTEHHIKSVIRSLALDVEGLPEDILPRVYYPCTATAEHLNDRYGVAGKISATVLVGVDGVKFRSLYVRDEHQRVHQLLVVAHLGGHRGVPQTYLHYCVDHVPCEG